MSSPDQISRLDNELDSDEVAPPTETISSSSSTLGSPKVELVMEDEDIEYGQNSPVAVIDDDELLFDGDPVLRFPYVSGNEPVMVTVRKIVNFFEYGMLPSVRFELIWQLTRSTDPVEGDDMFCRLGEWIATYLQVTKGSEAAWFESYEKHTEFWNKLPDIISALSRRRQGFRSF
jgi:hypothetical protein